MKFLMMTAVGVGGVRSLAKALMAICASTGNVSMFGPRGPT